MRKAYRLKYYSRNSFIRVGLAGRSILQAGSLVEEAGSSVQTSPRSSVCERPLFSNRCSVFSHQDPFLLVIVFSAFTHYNNLKRLDYFVFAVTKHSINFLNQLMMYYLSISSEESLMIFCQL